MRVFVGGIIEMKYMILKRATVELLENEVNEALDKKWKPLGPPFYADGLWTQAITRDE